MRIYYERCSTEIRAVRTEKLDRSASMSERICICCGDWMVGRGKSNAPSWNPNVCVGCASLLDAADEPNLPAEIVMHTGADFIGADSVRLGRDR